MCRHVLNAAVSVKFPNGRWYECPECFLEVEGHMPNLKDWDPVRTFACKACRQVFIKVGVEAVQRGMEKSGWAAGREGWGRQYGLLLCRKIGGLRTAGSQSGSQSVSQAGRQAGRQADNAQPRLTH